MLARLASNGVQVYVETHSEHILNGFRLAALKEDYDISSDDLRIYFFDKDFTVEALTVEKNGKIRNWPDGFFDQINKELAAILTIGTKR
jgi:predicted ATPase